MRRDLHCSTLPAAPILPHKPAPLDALLATLAALFSTGCSGVILKRPMLNIDRRNPSLWVRPGPQSRVTDRLRKLAARLKHKDPWVTLRNIHRWIKANTRKYRGMKVAVMGKRDADDLARQRTLSGCNDWGLLFAALARACGFPAVFVKAVHKGWAKRWVDGDETGPHMGHVFLEVYIQGRWILVDSTRGYYWTRYDPKDPNLPQGYYAYAKARDPGEMKLTSMYVVNRSLENVAEYMEGKKLHTPKYPRGFLIPTVAVLAPRAVFRYLKKTFPRIRFRRRTIRGLRRRPEKTAGMDVLLLAHKEKLRRVLHLVGDPLGLDGAQVNLLAAEGSKPRMLRTGRRPVCVVPGQDTDTLKAAAKNVLEVSPLRESAINADRCRIPASPAVPAPATKKPPAVRPSAGRKKSTDHPATHALCKRFNNTAPPPFRSLPHPAAG